MPDPLLRGAVVVRGGRYAVVWTVERDQLVLLPILDPARGPSGAMLAGDVVLELAELLACQVPIAGAVIRPRPQTPAPAEGYRQVGTVPGKTMCRVVVGLVRGMNEREAEVKWAADCWHRENAKGRPTNMLS